jgi:hemin uptake protein HemP
VQQRSGGPSDGIVRTGAGGQARPSDGMIAPDRPGGPPRPDAVLRSEELFRTTREVTILHAGAAYRLRLTANDKLILTK